MGLTYETFRKRFQQRMGVSPALYRTHRRIDAACELMRYTRMTNRQVAESLGLGDEFYLSRRFKQIKGVSPREFRARGSGGPRRCRGQPLALNRATVHELQAVDARLGERRRAGASLTSVAEKQYQKGRFS